MDENFEKNAQKFGGERLNKRDSNLELFRIITMLLIIAHHYVVNSGLIDSDGPIYSDISSFNSIFLLMFGAWGKTGINCFIMITGYFMCKSSITIKKYLKLIFEVYFYKISIFIIFCFTKYETFSVRSLIKIMLPVSSIEQNFTGCFLVFYLFIPFLNILIHSLEEKKHLALICLLLFTYTLFGTFHIVTFNYVSWFAVIYIIAAYIRIYPKKIFNSVKIIGVAMLISIVMMITSVFAGILLGKRMGINIAYYFTSDSNSILPLMTGVTSFMFFKNIDVKYNKVVNLVGASTFGVLLIHANSDTMRRWLWVDLLNNVETYNSSYLPLLAIGSVIVIFSACTVIDAIRIKYIEIPFFDRYWSSISISIEHIKAKFKII